MPYKRDVIVAVASALVTALIVSFVSSARGALEQSDYEAIAEKLRKTDGFKLAVLSALRLDKDFIGRDAVARRADEGERSAIAYLEIAAGDVDAMGGEAVFQEGCLVGSVSSGSIGATTGTSLAFAFVAPEAARPGTRLQVSILGVLRPATVLAEPVLDPDNHYLKADEGVHEPA